MIIYANFNLNNNKFPFDPLPTVWFSRNLQYILILMHPIICSWFSNQGQGHEVSWMVIIGIFCVFVWNPPRFFIQSSSKLEEMCRIIIQKKYLSLEFCIFDPVNFYGGVKCKKMKIQQCCTANLGPKQWWFMQILTWITINSHLTPFLDLYQTFRI